MNAPISWPRLERYHLGDVDPVERDAIDRLLKTCAISRQRLQTIRADVAPMPALPPLPSPPAKAANDNRAWRWLGGLAALAVAAFIAIRIASPSPAPQTLWVRGGELSINLVRERDGEISMAPRTAHTGDRFQVRLTCPPGERTVAVSVAQNGTRYRPFGQAVSVTCGNRIPLPGSFTLDSPGGIEVCAKTTLGLVCQRLAEAP